MDMNCTRHWRAHLLAPAVCALLLLGGCMSRRLPHQLDITGPAPEAGPIAVDVLNRAGSVTIVVSEKAQTPTVQATARSAVAHKKAPDWVAAEYASDAGKPVLRVVAGSPSGGAQLADLVIRLPACSGVRVRNSTGVVDLRDVSGAIDVQNGSPTSPGSDITVWTVRPIDAPMLLRTTEGDIELRLPTASKGSLNATADTGRVAVSAPKLALKEVVANTNSYRGSINGGGHEIRLATGMGDIAVRIQE